MWTVTPPGSGTSPCYTLLNGRHWFLTVNRATSQLEWVRYSLILASLAKANADLEQLRVCQSESWVKGSRRMTSALSITHSTKKVPISVPRGLKSTGKSQNSKRSQRTLNFQSTESAREMAKYEVFCADLRVYQFQRVMPVIRLEVIPDKASIESNLCNNGFCLQIS